MSPSIEEIRRQVATSLAAVLVALVCLVVVVFLLVGPENFLELMWTAVVPIIVIAAVAGLVRLPFRRRGFVLSVCCGVVVALAGVAIVWAFALSGN